MVGSCGDIDDRWESGEALNFERLKIWVWEDDAFCHHRVRRSKSIEWLWSTKLITEILSFSLGVPDRDQLTNYVFRFNSSLSILYHFSESSVRRYTSTSRITFPNRYFILSSLPPSQSSFPIDTDRRASQKLISLITSALLSVVKFEFFEDQSWIILSDEVLHYLLGGSTFWRSQRILRKIARVEVISRESPLGAPRRSATLTNLPHDCHDFGDCERRSEKLLQPLSFGESRLSARNAERWLKRGSADRKRSEQKKQESWMTLNN
jgi:hypothetical protein